jgi:hypothetical protein
VHVRFSYPCCYLALRLHPSNSLSVHVALLCGSASQGSLVPCIFPLPAVTPTGSHMLPQPILLPTNNESTFLLHNAQDLNSTYLFAMTAPEHVEHVVRESARIYTLWRTPALPIIFNSPSIRLQVCRFLFPFSFVGAVHNGVSITFDESVQLCVGLLYRKAFMWKRVWLTII